MGLTIPLAESARDSSLPRVARATSCSNNPELDLVTGAAEPPHLSSTLHLAAPPGVHINGHSLTSSFG
jgi:hypothetical protein